jgi:alpha-glucosidase
MTRWWQDSVFYQIYPRSFADSNGDGIGDLQGIIGKLGYLASLGIDALWISPFFPSPQKDFGYDVADYRGVDPVYGTLDDAKALFVEAHRRGLRIVLDLVVNHSSDEHPWFKAARASKEAPEHDWYIWRPLEGKKPNNWICLFEQSSAWFPNPATGERYLCTFTPFQPEFNWRNPELRKAIYDVMRYWLDLGVDGFRLDVATAYIKDEGLRSNPFSPKLIPDLFQKHIYDRNRPEVHGIFREMRAITGDDRILVGETHGFAPELAAASYGRGDELHLNFNFDFMATKWSARKMREAAERWYALLPDGAWPVFTLSNHDQSRHAFRYRGRNGAEAAGRAKIAAALLLTLRGSPFLYYGEEIAMSCERVPRARLRDPLGIRTWPLGFLGRDPERSPMQWEGDEAGGFTTGQPWLPVNSDVATRNVAAQWGAPDSVLSRYRELIALRRAHPALREGTIRFLDAPEGVLAYERSAGEGGETIIVVLNFASRARPVDLGIPGRVLLGENGREAQVKAGTLELGALETLLILASKDP